MFDIFHNEPEHRTLQPGEILFRSGDDCGNCMFAVLDGEIEIDHGDRVVAKLGPGELVGEMGLIDRQPRAASAKAISVTHVAVVSEKRFLFLVQQHPTFALGMLRMLSHRLRANLQS
ncbi:MAG: Crp/Fnr family transcriptional regulator [Ramlibacter sp.]